MHIKAFKKIIPIFLILFAVTATNAIAQQPVEFTAGQYHFTIPKFIEGTVEGFDNDFVKRGIIPGIKQSAAPVEIRVYRWTQGQTKSLLYGRVFVIRLDSGIVKCVTYAGRGKLAIDMIEPDDPNKPQLELANIVDSIQYYKWATYAQPPIATDSLFKALIRYKIFELKDEPLYIQSLEASQPNSNNVGEDSTILKCADCFADESLLVEVKVGNRIRNFRLMARGYGEPVTMRPHLHVYANLRDFIYRLMYQ